jgi:mitochondrial fission process protein 1
MTSRSAQENTSPENPNSDNDNLPNLRLQSRLKHSTLQEIQRMSQIYSDVHEEEYALGYERFLGYIGGLGRSLKLMLRYAAYSSDVGEAFRPVVHKNVVRGAYAVSWLYVIGDVSYETYDKYYRLEFRGWDMFHITSKRLVFQTFASMALPAFTIHSVVHYTKDWIFKKRFPQYLRWGPTICGLCVVPFLPVMFDEPVEIACHWAWERMLPLSPAAHKKMEIEEAALHGHHHHQHGGGNHEHHGEAKTEAKH